MSIEKNGNAAPKTGASDSIDLSLFLKTDAGSKCSYHFQLIQNILRSRLDYTRHVLILRIEKGHRFALKNAFIISLLNR